MAEEKKRQAGDPPVSGAKRDKPRGRRAKLEHFAATADGEYIYTGGYYVQAGGKAAHRRATAVRCALGPGALALLVIAGCLPVGGMMGGVYVILPYAAALLAAVSVTWAVARITYWGHPVRAYVYEATALAIPRRCVAAAVLSALAGAGEGLYLALHGPGSALGPEIIFLLLTLGAAGAMLALRRLERRLQWSPQEKK